MTTNPQPPYLVRLVLGLIVFLIIVPCIFAIMGVCLPILMIVGVIASLTGHLKIIENKKGD